MTDDEAIPPEALDLMATLIEKSMADTQQTTTTLLGNYIDEVARLRATIDIIRDQVDELLTGDFMPTSRAIRRALIASPWTLVEYMEAHPDEYRTAASMGIGVE